MKLTKLVRHLTALLAIVVVASCTLDAPVSPSAPEAPAPSDISAIPLDEQNGLLDDGLVGRLVDRLQLLECRPLPYARETEVVGPSGGVIDIGPHRLVIPRGALGRNVRITAEIVHDDVNSIRFSPEGLQFDKKATLTMSYANCDIVGILLPKQIVYTSELLRILELIPSLDNLWQKKTTGRIDHFSRYAVGW